MVKNLQQPAEFSRLVPVDRIGESDLIEEIAATDAERAALADRFGWLSMRRLTATVRLRRLRADLVRVSGRYEADLDQPCVVTLAPVPADVSGEFSLLYAADGGGQEALATAAAAEEDPPEPIVGDRIDIGEAVVQQLAVVLDQYPRAPDAALPEELTGEAKAEAEGQEANPFAVLAKLKRRH